MRSGRRGLVQDDKRFRGCCPGICKDVLQASDRTSAYIMLMITRGRRVRLATAASYRGSRMRQIILEDVCACVASVSIVCYNRRMIVGHRCLTKIGIGQNQRKPM